VGRGLVSRTSGMGARGAYRGGPGRLSSIARAAGLFDVLRARTGFLWLTSNGRRVPLPVKIVEQATVNTHLVQRYLL
jgi:hypothetical protein